MGGLTAKQIIENLNNLTTKSQSLQGPASSISILSAPLLNIGQGPLPLLIEGLSDIVSTAASDINSLQGTSISKDADAKTVGTAFEEFTEAHYRLINILIAKASTLDAIITMVGQPLVAVLRQDESVIDTIAYALIDSIKVKAVSDQISAHQNKLNGALEQVISLYSGLRN